MPLAKIDNTVRDIYTIVAAELGASTTLKLLKNYEWDIPAIIKDVMSADERYKSKIKLTDDAVGRFKSVILSDVEEEIAKINESGVQMITLQDREYPKNLRKIPDPPFALFVKGTLPENMDSAIAIVGSRKVSDDGQISSFELGASFAEKGVVVVSGLALGVDGAAQNGVVSKGGKTVAVLGSGVNYIYPSRHTDLYHRILENGGAIISELTPYKSPTVRSFPIRNRVISGISRGVIVVEPKTKSGALITLDYAVKHGKIIYVMPPLKAKLSKEEEAYYYDRGIMVVPEAKSIVDSYVLNHELLVSMPQIEQHILRDKQLALKEFSKGKVAKNEPTPEIKEIIVKMPKIAAEEPIAKSEPVKKNVAVKKNGVPLKEKKKELVREEKKLETSVKKEETPKYYGKSYKVKGGKISDSLDSQIQILLAVLRLDSPTGIDEILHETGISISEVMSMLLILEINGQVLEVAPNQFILQKA